jgi:hypothetical protein
MIHSTDDRRNMWKDTCLINTLLIPEEESRISTRHRITKLSKSVTGDSSLERQISFAAMMEMNNDPTETTRRD